MFRASIAPPQVHPRCPAAFRLVPWQRAKSACFAEIARRGLASAAILLDLIVDLLAVSEGREARAFDSGNVDENILSAIVRLNKSESLGAVEPLHRSGRHMCIFLCNNCRLAWPSAPDRGIGVRRSKAKIARPGSIGRRLRHATSCCRSRRWPKTTERSDARQMAWLR